MAERDDVHRHFILDPRLDQLAAHHMGGEGRRIDRAAQTRPYMRDGADMVFMRVGENDAE